MAVGQLFISVCKIGSGKRLSVLYQKNLTKRFCRDTISLVKKTGCSAVDSAPHLGCGGREFESRHSDQSAPEIGQKCSISGAFSYFVLFVCSRPKLQNANIETSYAVLLPESSGCDSKIVFVKFDAESLYDNLPFGINFTCFCGESSVGRHQTCPNFS